MKRNLSLLTALLLAPLAALEAAEPGLVAHWNFDEGSGDVANDITGQGHDATLKNIEWVRSPRGYALRFDGKEDVARYGQVASMNMSGDMTLAVWVKTDGTAAPKTHRLIFGDSGPGVERNLHLSLDSYDRLSFEWADGKTNASLLASATLLDGTWKHVAVVADSQARQATMYVDGSVVAKTEMPLPISRAPVKERLTGWFYNGYFQGDLDDVRLYARALTEQEVQALFQSQADVTFGKMTVLYGDSGAAPRGVASVAVHNWSQEPRRLELSGTTMPRRDITLRSGEEIEVALGEVALSPVWTHRNDLFLCAQPHEVGRVSVAVHRGELVESLTLGLTPPATVEPLQVQVQDPWQRPMPPGRTDRLELDVQCAMPAEVLRRGALQIRLVSRETGRESLSKQWKSPLTRQPLVMDVSALPWGAYDATICFVDARGKTLVSTKRLATILPDGPQQIRVLNNLVSELMDARARGLLDAPRIEFMNPRDGWIWFRAAGACAIGLGDEQLLSAEVGKSAAEAMRLLPAGKHVLSVTGTPGDLTVRAIPALVYNVYPSAPRIAPFGSNTWERLKKHTLPNTNMIESPRSAKGPNVVSQRLQGLQPGRLYSVKLITGDLADLQGGKTRRDQQAVSIQLGGAEILDGGFRCPFQSARGPKPFDRESPFWMTYHWLCFRAGGPTAKLVITDWAKPEPPGGPIGQQVICSFVEVQPVLED